jgi:hypothetical protein
LVFLLGLDSALVLAETVEDGDDGSQKLMVEKTNKVSFSAWKEVNGIVYIQSTQSVLLTNNKPQQVTRHKLCLWILLHTVTMKRHDKITITGGKYKGRRGTFIK